MANQNKYLIVIVGPTAIGKTALSIALAKHYQTEIFSADSRQFFKEMAIGTAAPTVHEMQNVPHHYIHNCSIFDPYNVGKYEAEIIPKLTQFFLSNDFAILVGGSGLYIDAVCFGIDDIPKDDDIRKQLIAEYETYGILPLQNELLIKDPYHHANSNIKNPQRLIRALEVCRLTQKTYTSFRSQKPKERPFKIIKVGINTQRELLYNRINLRVDQMIENGLLEEAQQLYTHKHLNALNTVGYKEFFDFFEAKINLEETIDLIKKNTRNFAKRQLTWFNKDKNTHWVCLESAQEEAIKIINAISKHSMSI